MCTCAHAETATHTIHAPQNMVKKEKEKYGQINVIRPRQHMGSRTAESSQEPPQRTGAQQLCVEGSGRFYPVKSVTGVHPKHETL